MNADIQNIVILIYKATRLLQLAVYLHLFQPCKPPYAMVNVRNIITRIKPLELFERNDFFLFVKTLFQFKAVVTLKNLVVGITSQLHIFVNKPFVKRKNQGGESNFSCCFYFL